MTDTPPAAFDVTTPHSARVWNYWLGGKDNFEADRAVGDRVSELAPGVVGAVGASRAFLGRVVGHLAGEAGVRQFLDVGCGLPTAGNTHDVAQGVAPECRVVYVDNDPMVLVHARALLVGTPEGATAYIEADVHDPEKILVAAAETLDFTRPVALVLSGIMGHVYDPDEACAIVKRLVDAVPSGSHLMLDDLVLGVGADTGALLELFGRDHLDYRLRGDPEQIARFFDGLELLEPGVVPVSDWRPDDGSRPAGDGGLLGFVGGVARKP